MGPFFHSVVCFCLPDWGNNSESIASSPCGAEIEPGHVNASKYLRVTEQHMTQLGIPVFNSVPPAATSLKWTPDPYSEADLPIPTQPAEQQPPQATGKPALMSDSGTALPLVSCSSLLQLSAGTEQVCVDKHYEPMLQTPTKSDSALGL